MPFKSRERRNEYAKLLMRRRRTDPIIYQAELEYARARRRNGEYRRAGICEVCGYSDTVDLHHEGMYKEEYILCPNCHALITRGIKTLIELLPPPVTPYTGGRTEVLEMKDKLDADGNVIPELD